MKIETTRFGTVEVEEEKVLEFPHSIPGFTSRKFVLLTLEDQQPFRWLQSADDPDLAFVILDPFPYFKEYKPIISAVDLAFLDMDGQGEALLFVLCVVREGPIITANLLAPILINPNNNRGKQVILLNQDYPVRQPLNLMPKVMETEAVS